MTYTTVDLAGKVALVTGGSRGIGAAIARRLARDGAAVAVTYNASPEKAEAVVREIEAAGGRALAVRADSADVGAVRNAVATTVETFGGIDVLVNNAGILVHGTVDQYSIDDFDRMVAVNVRAVFVAVQEAARHLKPGGRVINIGSMVADRTGFPGASVYGMTKAAVASLTRGLAHTLGVAAGKLRADEAAIAVLRGTSENPAVHRVWGCREGRRRAEIGQSREIGRVNEHWRDRRVGVVCRIGGTIGGEKDRRRV